jgi:adenylosuccinate lyase
MKRAQWVRKAIQALIDYGDSKKGSFHGVSRMNMMMPGDGRYQPEDLAPYLGYDQWAGWLIIVEWAWLRVLAKMRVMPAEDAALLKDDILLRMIFEIVTTKQDLEERKTKHDIIALTNLMKQCSIFPVRLHKWLHYCATSYDIISTAYALQLQEVVASVALPKMRQIDVLWRNIIEEHAATLQAGRTHLQTALPITFGFGQAPLHSRFVRNCRATTHFSNVLEIKFTGAVGTSASQRVMIGHCKGEDVLSQMLGMMAAPVSTQIAPPESMQQVYHALMLVSGTLGNLGEDVRLLQSSAYQELVSSSSTSSAMSHKTANPIAAEQLLGMSRTVVSEYLLVAMNMVSDLQRDLSNSSCMRRYSSILVYTYQQLLTAERMLKSFNVDIKRCRENLAKEERYLTAEVLHLSLGKAGLSGAHHFVNKEIMPIVQARKCSLGDAMDIFLSLDNAERFDIANLWRLVSIENKECIYSPELYIGQAIEIAQKEAKNAL